jgi:hypothetical protein
LKRSEKRGWEKTCPEEAGESQEGLNAPVASGREPAGTTEGGDNLPRRCRTRGEANREQIPFLKSRISKMSNNVPFSVKNGIAPVIKQFPYPRPFD